MKMERGITLFLNYCRSKQLRPRTIGSYEQALRLFARWLREAEEIEDVEKVTDMVMRGYILDLQERGKYTACINDSARETNHPEHRPDYMEAISNTTINNYLRDIRAFFNWLVEIEALSRSPMRKIKLLHQQRKAKEYLEDNELIALMKGLDRKEYQEYRDMIIMMLMLDTGMRIGETLSIEMKQVDLFEQTIYLPAEKTKSRKGRMVFFSMKVTRELRRWISYKDQEGQSDYLFPVQQTGYMLKIGNYETNLRNYLKRVGIEKHITPHTFRNNFAKRCLMAGMDIYTLSRILGHSSVKITERAYLDITDEDLKLQYRKFSPIDGIFYK